ncbi:hypothetical protein HDV03_000286 [Kappamyces sp. JEL0829]|nr:hypothetical protein HDV03_000286 [Kappamyces sp. JEL0829]
MDKKQTEIIGEINEGTKRHLQSRHLQMIAIGGTIGTGLFIKSGSLITTAGPFGALLAYLIAGISVFCVVMSLGEMAALFPVSGSFNAYSERFVDPALGFTSGWSYWFQWVLTLPVEVLVAADLLGFWIPQLKGDATLRGVVIAVLLTILLALNLISVKGYGETEYWLSILKVLAIVIFIFTGIILVFSNHYFDFSNWGKPDPFAGAGFVSVFSAMVGACFAFGGTELVGITAGEAANPRKSIPRAIKGTFWRIMVFYIISIFLIGLILSPSYLSALSALDPLLQSPFVIVFQQAKIPFADHIMNGVAFIAIFSAANSSVYASSRTLMSLCQNGQGPAFLAKTSRFGVPIAAVLLSTAVGACTFATLAVPGQVLFDFLTNLVGLYIIVTWMLVCVAHIRFRSAYIAQGYSLDDLPYKSLVGTTGDYIAIAVLAVVIVLSGLTFYNPFSGIDVVKNFVGLIIYPILYVGHKAYHKNWKLVPLHEVDFVTGHVGVFDGVYQDEEEPTTWYGKLFNAIA